MENLGWDKPNFRKVDSTNLNRLWSDASFGLWQAEKAGGYL